MNEARSGEPGLVIFDCDGVLVDSEPISVAVLIDTIAGLGGAIDEETAYRRFLGRSMATIVRTLHDEFGLAVGRDHLDAMRLKLYERFRAELRPIPGIAAALAAIRTPRCVASSSQPERIRLSLGVTGLLESFEPHLYSATMVDNGKPAPDLFLHAARSMGIDPARCVVVEDSPAGIEAAKRAGMRVFAFVGGTHAAPSRLTDAVVALGPERVFDDMRLLPVLLASAGETKPLP